MSKGFFDYLCKDCCKYFDVRCDEQFWKGIKVCPFCGSGKIEKRKNRCWEEPDGSRERRQGAIEELKSFKIKVLECKCCNVGSCDGKVVNDRVIERLEKRLLELEKEGK